MKNKHLSKKIIISAIIAIAGGWLIAGGVLFFPNFRHYKSVVTAPFQWSQSVGNGVSVPACTSSSNNAPTCVDGKPNVTVSWTYNGAHGACASANVVFRKFTANGPANSRMAYGAINGKFYIAQGSQLGTGARVYNPETEIWSTINSAPAAATAPASAVANNKLYSIGSQTFEYDPNLNQWYVKTAPPIDLTWSQATTIDNLIYVFLGASAYKYDPLADNWTSVASPPNNHPNWPAVAQVGGIIYVIGGGGPYVDAYNPSTNSWTPKANIPVLSKAYATGATLGSNIYVFGGGDWDDATAEIWRYNPSTNAWSQQGVMRNKRNTPAAATIGSYIYVYGGEYPGVYLNNFTVYPTSVVSGLTCPPETNNYTWADGQSNTHYSYQVYILDSALTTIDGSEGGEFTTPACAPASQCSGGVSIGLKATDSGGQFEVAVKANPDAALPLRIYKSGVTYGILLTTDFLDPKASKYRVRTTSGTKAICKFP